AFGTSDAADPFLFTLPHCLLDGQTVNLVVRIRPPTAGQSIICIDGGGVRGIIPPAILNKIQEQLDLPIPVQEFFTMAYGVSAGALIVLAMFANGWSVERCTIEFEQLARMAFRPNLLPPLPGANWIRSILLDSMYAESNIETPLKTAFGDGVLTEAPYAKRVGSKIGVLTATVVRPSLCLFTNYNGIGKERDGYLVLREADNVKTWEV
ncbi:patatin phospholipase, partial [Fusarium mexicanum]